MDNSSLRLTVRMSQQMLAAAERKAAKLGITISELIRRLVADDTGMSIDVVMRTGPKP